MKRFIQRIFLIAMACLGWSGWSYAQIDATEFLCVQNDTLFWEQPNPACGPVEGYEIYYSQQENGPFSLLTTINDPSTLQYFHNHLSDETFYYYIITLADCPTQQAIPSDTLDNRPPRPPVMESVSVVNGRVEVHWSPSVSAETIGYIIYRATSLGTIPIDTVYNGTTYTDDEAFPDEEEQYYYVLSLDACGNTSIFDITHHTIFARASVDSCRQSAKLSWTTYDNWSQGIMDHIVYVSENGGPEFAVDTLDAGDSTYTLQKLNDSTQYCVSIEARENQSGELSRSNALCFTPDIVEPMNFIYLLNGSISGTDEVSLIWEWDTDAELSGMALERTDDELTELMNGIVPYQPPMAQEQYTDNTIAGYDGPLTYQIQTTDLCDTIARSNEIKTIFLRGENGEGATNQLSWTPFSSSLSTVENYEIYTVSGSMSNAIATLPPDSLNYRHALDVTETQNASLCYQVIATHRVDLPGEPSKRYESRSNVVCLDQDVSVFVPNAFAPQGINQFFKPVFVFPQNISSYSMNIYDRYGGKVFSTSSLDEGWFGKEADGDRSPGGVYVYLLQWKTTNGRTHEKRGTVLLIR